MKKKRIMKQLAVVSALSMVLALTACGGKTEGTAGTEQETVENLTGEEHQTPVQEETQDTQTEETQDVSPTEIQDVQPEVPSEETPNSSDENQAPIEDVQSEEQAESALPEEEEQGEMTGETLAGGAISADGQIIRLGMGYAEIEKGKWAISAKDHEKYEAYSLNPRTTSGSAMALYSEDYGYDFESFHIMVSLRNESEQPVPYLEGTVDYISIPNLTRTEKLAEVILPGGLTLESTEEEFRAVYGEPVSEYDDEATGFRSLSFEDGEVRMGINWVKGSINEITLSM